MTRRSMLVAALAVGLVAAVARGAQAQTFGVGARLVSVSGSDSPALDKSDSSRTRLWGGYARLHLFGSLGFEAAMDYQSITNDTETARVRNTPLQVSLLLLPVRKSFAPYLLGGLGWYRHKVEALDAGDVVATAHSTDFGYHLGGGLQIKLGRHAAVFADYRYVWVDSKGFDGITGALKSAASVASVIGLVASLTDDNSGESTIKRGGSMWTGGLTIYF